MFRCAIPKIDFKQREHAVWTGVSLAEFRSHCSPSSWGFLKKRSEDIATWQMRSARCVGKFG